MRKVILIIGLLVSSICLAFENTQSQFPQASFNSVNTRSMSTSYTPQITPVGATSVYEPSESSPYRTQPRRNNAVDPGTDPNDPYATPIGDIPWLLVLVFSMLYIYIRTQRKRIE